MSIGIITHYYNSVNYGGNLQAYALCKFLNNNGIKAEQISYEFQKKSLYSRFVGRSFKENIVKHGSDLLRVPQKIYMKIVPNEIEKNINVMKSAVREFNITEIPHSKQIYDVENIQECLSLYDTIITGSDQVWNLSMFHPAFFLEFAPSTIKKISYSASVSMDSLTSAQLKIFEKNLSDFYAVSVREESAVELIQDVCPIPISCTLDPTLLLDKNDWEQIVAERIVQEDYIFCYFLGSGEKQRDLATEFAKKNNVKLVNIPYLNKNRWTDDKKFGDIRLSNISPQKWISLIKYAKYVFTDSFHAVVFSNIFKKQYFIFRRVLGQKYVMTSRIYSLSELYGTVERFCDTDSKEQLEYIETLKDIDFSECSYDLERKKNTSKKFLLESLLD